MNHSKCTVHSSKIEQSCIKYNRKIFTSQKTPLTLERQIRQLMFYKKIRIAYCKKGFAVAQLVEALRHKPEVRGFDA